ncbi:MAG TPA: hypothetical protein VFL98_03235 [Candidatus Paceibacterota bacterium]|nr:hypothetical protein [Candidatus Paceibacterota bacterium]
MIPLVLFAIASLAVLLIAAALALAAYAWLRGRGDAALAKEDARLRAEREAAGIVAHAEDEARDLMGEAQEASMRLASARASEDEKAARAFEARFDALLAKLEARLDATGEAIAAAEQHASAEALARLKASGETAQAHLEEALAALGKDASARIETEVAQAFSAARDAAAQYVAARTAAVDAQIGALISETVKAVLGKDMPESLTVELAQKALEEAKAAHVF